MKKINALRFAMLAMSAGMTFQLLGGCGDFLTRFAGAGAIVAGVVTLFGLGGN
ncbi:MAG: hypothetical protein ACKVS9_02420 [Phycisphaerae bacterium]